MDAWAEALGSQLPFGSVPFRHFKAVFKTSFKLGTWSQLPFGSVPFRHVGARQVCASAVRAVSITFRLSALSAPHAHGGWDGTLFQVSITFRLSALSARDARWTPVPALVRVSITFRLSALSALLRTRGNLPNGRCTSQLPFGSVPFRHG